MSSVLEMKTGGEISAKGKVNEPPLVDKDFVKELKLLKAIRQRIILDRVIIDAADQSSLSLGDLNLYPKKNGINVNKDDWDKIQKAIDALTKYLSDPQIRQVQLDQVTDYLVIVPICLLIISMSAALVSIFSQSQNIQLWYILWLAAMGGLGSAAFIYVNALSIQVDPTVNVISQAMLTMRILLGALFAIILAFPFDFTGFTALKTLTTNAATTNAASTPNTTIGIQNGSLMLLPFLLGFSTPLVMSILNKVVQSIQTLFGVQGLPPSQGGRGGNAERTAPRRDSSKDVPSPGN